MAPNKPKPSPPPAAVSESRKTIDALWLLEQFMHCDPPVILNVVGIAEATGMKPNTIVKRINAMQHRYPGFGIVTRTSGPRQSSNLAVSSPKANAASPAKKSAVKVASSKTDDKAADLGESEEEADSRRKTRARSRVEQTQVEDKPKDRKTRRQTGGSTVNDIASQEKTTTVRDAPQQTSARKEKTVSKPSHDAEDDGIDSAEGEVTTQKAATPKTRGGRKSAVLGEIKTVLTDPEVPAPRGRHASLKQDGDSKQHGGSSEEVGTAEHGHDHGLRRMPAPLDLSTKRKRSTSSDTSSSPLTPLPEVWKKLNKTSAVFTDKEEVDQMHQQSSTDIRPSKKKKSKINGSVSSDAVVTLGDVTKIDDLSTTQEASQAQPLIAEDLKLSVAKNGESQLVDEPSIANDPVHTAQLGHMADEVITTLPETRQDELPACVITGSSNSELVGQLEQSVEPSIQQDGLEATELESTFLTVDEQFSSKDMTVCNGPPSKSFKMPEGSSIVSAEADTQGESAVHTENPQPLKKTSFFSRPLEWMVWNPDAKRAKSATGL